MRRSLATGLVAPMPLASLRSPSRQFLTILDCPFWCGLGGHFLQLIYPSTYTTLPALAYSPVGTVALVGLAYNVGVVGAKHCWYTMELTAKDYVQDQKVATILRYAMLITILLAVEALFVES